MDRDRLIRAHFDAYSDLVWAQDLEPKFRAEGVEGAALEGWRQAWNRNSEGRDWEWWLENTKELSNAELEKQIVECKQEINAIGSKRQEKKDQNAFQEILNGIPDAERQPQEQVRTQDKCREM